MTTIDPGQRLATALRAQRGTVREAGSAKPAAPGAPTASSASIAPSVRRSPHTVSPAMAQRIAAIAPDDPDRPRKAVRIYLEAELAREFGAGLLNDPAFAGLLDAVQQRLEEDAHTAGAADALGRLLAAGKIKPR
jgi:hypothetical protein